MTQNSPSTQWKSLTNCLGRRVLSLALILLVLPLFVHAFLLYRQAIYQTSVDNLTNLSLLARAESTFVKQFIQNDILDLKTIEMLARFDHTAPQDNLNAQFAQLAVSEELSSFFLVEKNDSGLWQVLAAAHPERVLQKDIDSDEFNKILTLGTSVYLFFDPLTQKKELRIGFAISPNRIIVSGTLLEGVSSQLIKTPSIRHTPIAAFVTLENDLYYATVSNFSLTNCKLYIPEELVDITSLPKQALKIDDGYSFVGVKVPVATESFYLVIALTKDQFLDFSSQQTFNHLLQITILFALLGGGGLVVLTIRIAKPLQQLFSCLDEVEKGHLDTNYKDDRWGFDLNVLGQKFNQMLSKLNLSIEEAKIEKTAKDLLKQELSIGQDIQKAILTTSLHHVGSYNFSYAFAPAMEVSGDFYDVYKISEDKILFAVADTSGKGISACLYSLGARSMLRALAKSGASLDTILFQLNEQFLEDAEKYGTFITAFVGILNTKTNDIIYATCGHPPAYIVSKESLSMISTGGIALGIDSDTKYQTKVISLEIGQKLVIYTDGVIEACSKEGELYSQARLENFLKTENAYSSASIVQDLKHEVEKFSGTLELFDDVTILCVERV
jgi:serine phosphatase RsbU (regulator of sigma subunit)